MITQGSEFLHAFACIQCEHIPVGKKNLPFALCIADEKAARKTCGYFVFFIWQLRISGRIRHMHTSDHLGQFVHLLRNH
jgi:hypothetical protein